MKKFYKVMASLSLGLLVLGILFTVIAAYSGVGSYATANGGIELGEHIRIPFYWLDHRDETVTHRENQTPSRTESQSMVVIEPDSAHSDSATSVVASATTDAPDAVAGATSRAQGKYDIYKIDAELGAGEFVLERGEEFAVTTQNGDSGRIQSYTDDGVWKIEGTDAVVSFGKTVGRVTITVPQDFYPDELEIELGAGKMTLRGMAARYAEISVGAGQVEMKDCAFESAAFECSMGELLFDGTLRGRGSVDCGMGNVEIRTTGDKNEFGYSVDCGMGSVEIAGNKYSGLGAEATQNKEAKNFYEIDCGMGNVDFIIG